MGNPQLDLFTIPDNILPKMDAPNASIRVLVAMNILTEGFGCGNENLFEKCDFNLLARKALVLGDAVM